VLVVITLVLICLCCMVYLGNHIWHGVAAMVRGVLKELAGDGMEK
jgi:hypothetical protein